MIEADSVLLGTAVTGSGEEERVRLSVTELLLEMRDVHWKHTGLLLWLAYGVIAVVTCSIQGCLF